MTGVGDIYRWGEDGGSDTVARVGEGRCLGVSWGGLTAFLFPPAIGVAVSSREGGGSPNLCVLRIRLLE